MSSFFDELLADAEAAWKVITPLASVAASAAPVVASVFPSTAGAITAVEAGVAAIEKIAPTAISDGAALVTEGRQIIADLGPAGRRLSEIFGNLFHKTNAPQAVVLSPVTTAPTVPAAPAK